MRILTGGEGWEVEAEEGDWEGQHGGGQDPCRKRHQVSIF